MNRLNPRGMFLLPAITMLGAALTLFDARAADDVLPREENAATLFGDMSIPQVRFAADEIRVALAAQGRNLVEANIERAAIEGNGTRFVVAAGAESSQRMAQSLGTAPLANPSPQAYAIRVKTDGDMRLYVVLGADAAGAMYGGLDLAEAIRLGTLDDWKDGDHSAFIARRGIKFNIPLDLRTPSYSDCGDAAQQNIPEVWSLDFWREFLDEMARDRFNVLTLWNLHPFPSIVKVPEYPDVALDDVWRTTLPLDDSFAGSGRDMVRPEMLDHHEIVKKLTIEEKIQFWRDVMQYARDRGVEVYLFTWNIYTFGADGKYGITRSQSNAVTIDYFRASVRETVLTYPLLAGFGLTAGEQMDPLNRDVGKEEWLWRTYGEGIRDAKKIQPEREIRLIHRIHQTNVEPVLEQWKDYPGPFEFSFKYAQAHTYASTAPPFINEFLPRMPAGRRTWLTVRTDDIYSFRWGDPEFVRAFIGAMPGPEKTAGFYMGPDGFIWGREFTSTEPETPRQLVMRKQWFSFMLWGRLSYDPTLPDALFQETLAARYPEAPAEELFAAISAASKIIPQITRFSWGTTDFQWFPEACLSHRRFKGFYTVRDFIEGETMPGSGILKLTDYRQRLMNDLPLDGITPLEVAEALEGHARTALAGVARMRPVEQKELRLLLGDLEALAHLGDYYAAKIRGAAALMLFEATGVPERKTEAVRRLEEALEHWKRYAAVATSQYKPQLLNRVGMVDLNALTARVEEDLAMVKALR